MVYLDNAATSFPKPRECIAAALEAAEKYGANPGRGGYRLALRASEAVYSARERAAAFFGCPKAENVVFTLNTTYALNTAIRGLIKDGDTVLTSAVEHNSVARPLAALEKAGRIRVKVFSPVPGDRKKTAAAFEKAAAGCSAAVVTLCSNVSGESMPAEEFGRVCREKGMIFIADGAQAAGHLPVDIEKCGISALCVPGHKGLFGLAGCGMLILSPSCPALDPLVSGGSGVFSRSPEMPPDLPERLEAGTLPLVPVVSLGAGIDFITKNGLENIRARESEAARLAADGLRDMRGVTVYAQNGGIVLFDIDGMPPDDTAAELDRRGICVRSGLHCAPAAHAFLGTPPQGAVRASFGAFNTTADARSLVLAVRGALTRAAH